jgi:hypothetical protein
VLVLVQRLEQGQLLLPLLVGVELLPLLLLEEPQEALQEGQVYLLVRQDKDLLRQALALQDWPRWVAVQDF